MRAVENYQNPKKRLLASALATVSVTLGMGVGTIGAIFLLVSILNLFVSLPLVGQWINELLQWIDRFKGITGDT
jgi:hypothetical protein